MELRRLERESIVPLSDTLCAFVDKITYHNRFDKLEILGHLLTGHWQGLLIVEGSEISGLVIYEFYQQYGQKVCRLVLASGKGLTKAGYLLDSFLAWCKAQGCDSVEGAGRPGWVRVLASHGFTKEEITLRKLL